MTTKSALLIATLFLCACDQIGSMKAYKDGTCSGSSTFHNEVEIIVTKEGSTISCTLKFNKDNNK